MGNSLPAHGVSGFKIRIDLLGLAQIPRIPHIAAKKILIILFFCTVVGFRIQRYKGTIPRVYSVTICV